MDIVEIYMAYPQALIPAIHGIDDSLHCFACPLAVSVDPHPPIPIHFGLPAGIPSIQNLFASQASKISSRYSALIFSRKSKTMVRRRP